MLQSRTLGKWCFILAATVLLTFQITNIRVATAAESGCVTCHLDKEMLKKNITAEKGAKSALQSGAG